MLKIPIMSTTYHQSYRKLFLLTIFLLVFFSVIFAFSRSTFDLTGLGIGFGIGAGFTALLALLGYGQQLEVNDIELIFYQNLLSKIIGKQTTKLQIVELEKIRYGSPQMNAINTFLAINISTQKSEISFNPDTFDKATIRNLFRKIKELNSRVIFDQMATEVINSDA